MPSEIDLVKHLDEVNKVVEEYLKGDDATKISKTLNISRQKVVSHINEWKQLAASNDVIRARAKEALAGADMHFSKLITQAYEVIDEATTTANLSAKTTAIKLVLDIESRRIDMLQKAGLLENEELASEIMETERRQEVIVGILRDVASKYPEIRDEIMRRLSEVSVNSRETLTVVQDV